MKYINVRETSRLWLKNVILKDIRDVVNKIGYKHSPVRSEPTLDLAEKHNIFDLSCIYIAYR